MGVTKQYLRYNPSSKFNIICSPLCNIKFITYEGQEGRYVAVGACEDVVIWDLRLGEKSAVFPGEKVQVTCLAPNPNKTTLAAGYEDGTIKIFDLKTGEHLTTFSGHRSAITCLTFDSEGHRLASGAKDTDVILWDTVAENGIHRLCGHKGVVTEVGFLNEHNVLLSSSKDSLIKFWDLDTAHCFKTLVGHRTEVWAFCLLKDETYLVTGCRDNELRVWEIKRKEENEGESQLGENFTEEDYDGIKSPITCKKVGSMLRNGRGRVLGLVSDESGHILACHGSDWNVELFVVHPEAVAKEKWKKRIKKLKKKALNGESSEIPADEETQPSLRDQVTRLTSVKVTSKMKSVSVVTGRGGEIRIVAALQDNSIEMYSLKEAVKDTECSILRTISSQGHRSIVRAVAFSSDNLAIISASGESIKMWNRASQKCLRTVKVGYAVSVCFIPGDRHVLVGLKEGQLIIVDIAAGDILETVPAHTKELWSICITPEQHGCVTGGGDQSVKFWNFELIPDPNSESKAKVLSVLHKRTLKLEESVLAVKISPNGNFIAVSLLDCTIKIFFMDTLKFFLSLYGHKLPVICMDISYDSTIIATGSADRNMKIWGLDFGDCHRSIFAHDDSIMGLQFVPKTHYIFTCGKEGKVKQWDADSYNKILTLQGHQGEANTLAVSPNGQYVVSSGSDRVLRLFERTLEPLVLEDEQEQEREEEEKAALATGDVTVVPGLGAPNLPSRKTVGSENIAEQLLECLEIGKEYSEKLKEHAEFSKASGKSHPVPPPPALMQAYQAKNAEEYLLEVLKRVRSSDLEESLLILPFSAVCELLARLPALVAIGSHTELIHRVMIFLLKIHHRPIVSSPTLVPVLLELQKLCFDKVNELRDTVGVNLYGFQFLQRQYEEKEGGMLFREALLDRRNRNRKRRKRERTAQKIVL
ncbi:Lissencephaly-1 homolog [Gryllus bimaculatus]|nr:Lissencephaly-1 homolog [Gryllus bimaculatus]